MTSLGANFALLGIVEFPSDRIPQRFKTSQVSSLPLTLWNNDTNTSFAHVWTDGSCDFNKFYLHTIGAFSVVGEGGKLLAQGPVHHITLTPYTCELWAIIHATSLASQPVVIHSDCLS